MSRYSNETQCMLHTLSHTIIEAAKERILATTLPPNSKISHDLEEVYSVTSTGFPFTFFLLYPTHLLIPLS